MRIQIHSRRYRVADSTVWRDDNEILSPEDRLVPMAFDLNA
jgi:hypothetical protein